MRWDTARLAAYTQYGEAIKSMFHVVLRIAAGRGADALVEPLEPNAGWPVYAEAEERRTRTWETMLMLGDPATIDAARRLHQSVWRLEQVARQTMIELHDWDAARLGAAEARDNYYACARASLGVAGRDQSADLWDALTWLPRQRPVAVQTED